MPVIEELICIEQDGTISFGNYKLGQKAKTVSYTHLDVYKRQVQPLSGSGMTSGDWKHLRKMSSTVSTAASAQIT